MPRLLLVDDNPSIHKIAETLLAPTDVQLVCCGSGAEALALLGQGERFDVALLDTTMAGMDGWALLQELRGMGATARIPVAMMAGVLDSVDPEKLKHAPIQGFLKKPVELRDLGERLKRLMETPVLPPPPPASPAPAAFQTQPGLRIPDLLTGAEPAAAAGPGPEPAGEPGQEEDDLLILGPEDLFAETEAPQDEPDGSTTLEIHLAPQAGPGTMPVVPAPDEEPLDLEELDLESLRGMSFTAPLPEAGELAPPETDELPQPEAAEPPAPAGHEAEAAPESGTGFTVPEFLLADTLPEASLGAAGLEAPWDNPEYASELPDLGPDVRILEQEAGAPAPEEPFDWSDESDSLLEVALAATGNLPPALAPAPAPAMPDGLTLSDVLETSPTAAEMVTPVSLKLEGFEPVAAPEPAPAAEAVTPTVPTPYPAGPLGLGAGLAAGLGAGLGVAGIGALGLAAAHQAPAAATPAPAPAPAPGVDPLKALLDDPVLMDRLAQAVVARLGDQVLREVAWEVMPELAARLHTEPLP